MHIDKLQTLLPTSFECDIAHSDGSVTKETINIKLNRLAFKTVSQKEFLAAIKNVEQNPTELGKILAGTTDEAGNEIRGLLASWEIFSDVEATEMYPITVDNIINQPFDFVVNLAHAVVGKLFPNPQKAASSGGGSAAAESSTNAPSMSNNDTPSQLQAASGA